MDTSNLSIKTKNLLLKAITLDYQRNIFKEFTSEITTHMFPTPAKKIEETIEFIETSIKNNQSGKEFLIVILDNQTKEFLGCSGLHKIDTKHPELGIWIKKSAHGNAYGKETIIALKDWAEQNLDYEYLVYPVVDVNYASRRIPEFLGGKVSREYDEVMNGRNQHLLEYHIYPPQS
jgi:[ribosomal protein S5]-alanine N-acetyltransferase